jgi:hypothetical protein
VCLIHHFLGTFYKWYYFLIPIWNSAFFRWQCPPSSPTTLSSWFLFNCSSSFVPLAEGPFTSVLACLSPLKESQCFLWSLIAMSFIAFLRLSSRCRNLEPWYLARKLEETLYLRSSPQSSQITVSGSSYTPPINISAVRISRSTVCRLMMVVWPKHVVAITSEEEKRNCCVDGPFIA